MFLEEDAQILAMPGNALPTLVFDKREGDISSIQVPERDTESCSNAIAYAVYALICLVRDEN